MELKDIDLSDMEFWKRPLRERAAAFATLRSQLLSAFINGVKHLPAEWTPVGQ
jgi:hypothetical protein